MTSHAGSAEGGVRSLLRGEGLAVLAGALLLYAGTGRSWWMLAALFLVPDVAILGYRAGPRIGALAYNAVHSYIGPLGLAVAARGDGVAFALALIWLAHCGMDRAAGFGIKYASAFGDTHLGRIGGATGPGTGASP